jgi:hypothetical protein
MTVRRDQRRRLRPRRALGELAVLRPARGGRSPLGDFAAGGGGGGCVWRFDITDAGDDCAHELDRNDDDRARDARRRTGGCAGARRGAERHAAFEGARSRRAKITEQACRVFITAIGWPRY